MGKSEPQYRRILLKISGEVLSGEQEGAISPDILEYIVREVKKIHEKGIQVALVVGGGNIIRGVNSERMGLDRISADFMGMLGTIVNSIALKSVFNKHGIKAEIFSAIPVGAIVSPHDAHRAQNTLKKGTVVIFAGGTGNPYFSTDSSAALRAIEINADVLLKGTKVDGVYTADPSKDRTAKKLDELTFDEMVLKNLRVMDMTAATLCRDNGMKVIVFNLLEPDSLLKIISGEKIGTLIRG